MTNSSATTSILFRLGRAYHAAATAFEAATGTSAARWRLLYLVAMQPGLSQKQLIRQVRVDPGSITRQLGALARDGLICRKDDPRDARLTRLDLTRKGRTEVRRVMRKRRVFLDAMIAAIRPRDLEICARTLDRICANLGDDVPLPGHPR